jgi:hypothetical protein
MEHKTLFLTVDPVQKGVYFAFEKILAGLTDHLLFLAEFLRNEDMIRFRFMDKKFAP